MHVKHAISHGIIAQSNAIRRSMRALMLPLSKLSGRINSRKPENRASSVYVYYTLRCEKSYTHT